MMRRCIHCEVERPQAEFTKMIRGREVLRKSCNSCRATARRYYLRNRQVVIESSSRNQEKNRDKRRAYLRDYAKRIRNEAIDKLGGVCVHCGFADRRALQIDHVNGDGWSELRSGLGTFHYLKKVIADKDDRYQLLCANCNWIKRHEENEQPFGPKGKRGRP